MINMVKQTLQKELTQFINLFSEDKFMNITKSAFCQSRLNLNPRAFKELNNTIITEFYKNSNNYKTWNKFRLLAIDGSTTQVPNAPEIISYFGKVKNRTSNEVPTARISTLFDTINNKIIDSQINSFKTGEYDLLLNHLNFINKKDLILMDRGYGAIWLMQLILSKKSNFLIRVQSNFLKKQYLKLSKSTKFSMIIDIFNCSKKSQNKLKKLEMKFKKFQIRLVKVILDNGEIEILATSLLDEKKFPNNIFKELYFMRWSIETNYGHLKRNIQLENFTGKSVISVEQDFYANCFISNLQSLIIADSQKELDKNKKNTKLKYKINRNLSLGFLKFEVIKIIIGTNQKENYEKLKKLFQLEAIPIRNNRKFSRKKIKSRKYSLNAKKAI